MAYHKGMKLRGIRQAGRRIFAALALLALVMPAARLAFACQAMPEGWSGVCCCVGEIGATCQAGDGCDAHLAGYQSGCCDVSLQTAEVVPAAVFSKAALAPDSPQSPLAAIAVEFHSVLGTSPTRGVPRPSVPIALSGRFLYLTTARLRI